MAGRIRIVPAIAIAVFLLGGIVSIPSMGNAAARNTFVRGIVGYVQGDMVTVSGKTYDLKGARYQDGNGVSLAQPVDLRGQTVEILFRGGKVETVSVYRTLPR